MTFRVFLAGSKRNEPAIRAHAAVLRGLGCEVFDHWLDDYVDWSAFEALVPDAMTLERFYNGLPPSLVNAMCRDLDELSRCDMFALVLPCGHDAHTELGIALSLGVPAIVIVEGADVPFRLSGYYLATDVIEPGELGMAVAVMCSRANKGRGESALGTPNITE